MPEQVDADLVLVDEISMLDMAMTWYLFHALPPMCRLVLVGDADQLSSVGPGAVLSELLRCGRIPMVMLDKVFRQSEGSMIAENARHIRHGDTDLRFDGDFQFWGSADIQQSAEWLERLYMQEVRRYGVDNVALLTPFRAKTETGVRSMNERLRTLVNPPGANKPVLSLGRGSSGLVIRSCRPRTGKRSATETSAISAKLNGMMTGSWWRWISMMTALWPMRTMKV